jgi:type I pantothenate kinase
VAVVVGTHPTPERLELVLKPIHDPDAPGDRALPSPYVSLSRAQWAERREGTPLTLTERDLERIRGINSEISMREVVEVYLPLSRLLNMYVSSTQALSETTSRFLGNPADRVPYVIGIAGSVAAGKSTCSRLLQALLSRWPNSPNVALVTTDGFLYPNAELERRGLMRRKGFPESYDVKRLLEFVASLKAGERQVRCPVYSHITYDIVADQLELIEDPDIVLIEGLNVLQSERAPTTRRVFVSDFFDLSIYVDAPRENLRSWYIHRFLKLRDTAFQRPDSYFHRYASMSDEEATAFAESIWEEINLPNLLENILPTRERADLILHKGVDHSIDAIELRKI